LVLAPKMLLLVHMQASAKGHPLSIGVVGMGMMGRGIAQVAAMAGLRTTLCRATLGDPMQGRRAIEQSIDRAVQAGRTTTEARDRALERLVCTSDLDALSEADLVVESIVEDLDRKRALLAMLEQRVGPHAVLATNTSSLPLGELAAALDLPQRFIGLHFFSPVPAMKLVEVASLPTTEPDALATAESLVAALGKTSIRVGESAGLIVNRLLVPYLLDASRAIEHGLASAASIDAAMRLGCGHPMGPLELADAIGLDVVLSMAQALSQAYGEARYAPPTLLTNLVASGKLGKKTGAGLYPSAQP